MIDVSSVIDRYIDHSSSLVSSSSSSYVRARARTSGTQSGSHHSSAPSFAIKEACASVAPRVQCVSRALFRPRNDVDESFSRKVIASSSRVRTSRPRAREWTCEPRGDETTSSWRAQPTQLLGERFSSHLEIRREEGDSGLDRESGTAGWDFVRPTTLPAAIIPAHVRVARGRRRR